MLLLIPACVTFAEAADESVPPLTVRVETDKNPASIGDRIRYTIEVEAEKGLEVKFPSFAENIADLTIRDFGSSESGFWKTVTYTTWYILDTYETGTFTIPGAVIRYRDENTEEWQEIRSDEIIIEVKSLLDATEGPSEIRDIRPPVSMTDRLYIYIGLALLACITAAALIIYFLKRRRNTQRAAEPPVPAHIIAFEAFEELKGKDYLEKGRTREYYFELSNIVRHYIENRFFLKAPEMTTDEFLASLKNTDRLHLDHKLLLEEFLSHCDMVKFARYQPEEAEISSSYTAARELVEQTKDENGEDRAS